MLNDKVDLANLKEGEPITVELNGLNWTLEKQGESYTLTNITTVENEEASSKNTTTTQFIYNLDGAITSMSIKNSSSSIDAEEDASETIISEVTMQYQDGQLSETNTVTYDKDNDSWTYEHILKGNNATTTNMSIDIANLSATEAKDIFDASLTAVKDISGALSTTEITVGDKTYTITEEEDGSWKIKEKALEAVDISESDIMMLESMDIDINNLTFSEIEGEYTYTDEDEITWTVKKEGDNWTMLRQREALEVADTKTLEALGIEDTTGWTKVVSKGETSYHYEKITSASSDAGHHCVSKSITPADEDYKWKAIEIESYSNNNYITASTTRTYNDSNNIIEEEYKQYDDKDTGELLHEYTRTYNDDGTSIEKGEKYVNGIKTEYAITYNKEGKIKGKATTFYDDNDNKTGTNVAHYTQDGKTIIEEYDEADSLIKMTISYMDDGVLVTKRYDKDRHLIDSNVPPSTEAENDFESLFRELCSCDKPEELAAWKQSYCNSGAYSELIAQIEAELGMTIDDYIATKMIEFIHASTPGQNIPYGANLNR